MFFDSKENYLGIDVYVSKGAAADYEKTRELVQALYRVKEVFRKFRITLPISDLFKSLIVVKGKERDYINKKYNVNAGSWRAFYTKQLDMIVFDLNHFKAPNQLINTLVHEIGHAIHTKFIDEDSREYAIKIGVEFSSIMRKLRMAKREVLETSGNASMQEMIKAEAEDEFYDFLDLLDESTPNFVSLTGTESSEELQSKLEPQKGFSQMSQDMSDEYSSYRITMPLSCIEKMIEIVMDRMPSEYGTSDGYEYFAESFRRFILDYENLSQNNINAIVNTLTKARANNRIVMNAGKDLSILNDYLKIVAETLKF